MVGINIANIYKVRRRKEHMATKSINLQDIYARIQKLQRQLDAIAELISESSLELSDEAVAAVKRARKAPRSDYVELA